MPCLSATIFSDLVSINFLSFLPFQYSATSFLTATLTVNTDRRTALLMYQIKLTLLDRLLVREGERSNKEFGFSYLYPVVQNFYRPNTGSQGQIQRRFVVSKFSTGFNQNIIRCCNYINGVHPNYSNGDIGAFSPFLHPNWLICWAEESSKIPEKPLLGVPFGANLKSQTTLLVSNLK